MIKVRVDYSGLDWSKVGTKTELRCNKCGGVIYHSEKHDARFCSSCGRWIDKACKSQQCWFCRDRPDNAIGLFNKYNYTKQHPEV